MNFCLEKCSLLIGTWFQFRNINYIPNKVPVIFVANHQSMYDIIGIIWHLRRFHAKFVSKKELGRGIPSVSYNLRHGGSVLIDRKDPKQAISAIKELGQYIEKHQRSAVIFPEGTRSKDGTPKRFSENGIKILCKYAPSAVVVPISINNSWKMVKFGLFPMGLGNRVEFLVHEPITIKDYPFEELMIKIEKTITQSIHK